MAGRLVGFVLVVCLGSVAAGCSTCVSVEATYDEAWQATRAALLAEPDMVPGDTAERYGEGVITAVVVRPAGRDELHYEARIKPAGGEERQQRSVCVRVREVDFRTGDLNEMVEQGERMNAERRPDLEAMVTARIQQALAPAEAPGG